MYRILLIAFGLCFSLNAVSQLKPNEKPDIIYDTRPKAFKRVTFRLNGEELRNRQLRKVLLENERSAPLFKKGRQQHAIGLPFATVGLLLFQGGLSTASQSGPGSNTDNTNAYLMAGAGLLINIFGDIQLFKGSRNMRNAINAYNQISLMDKPSHQNDSIKNKASIIYRPSYFGRNQYYLDGKKVSIKTIDNALAKSEKAKPFYERMQKNKKIET